jgi:c-di-GMP-binding flagellar brake protein YcgR
MPRPGISRDQGDQRGREAAACPATLTLADQTRLRGATSDLSRGGVCLLLDQPVNPAQYCAVAIETGSGNALAMGQVIYSQPADNGLYKTGIQFLQIDPPSATLIASLVDRERV